MRTNSREHRVSDAITPSAAVIMPVVIVIVETLYQDSGLAPHLSVSGNVFLGRELTKPGLLGKMGFLSQRARKSKLTRTPWRG